MVMAGINWGCSFMTTYIVINSQMTVSFMHAFRQQGYFRKTVMASSFQSWEFALVLRCWLWVLKTDSPILASDQNCHKYLIWRTLFSVASDTTRHFPSNYLMAGKTVFLLGKVGIGGFVGSWFYFFSSSIGSTWCYWVNLNPSCNNKLSSLVSDSTEFFSVTSTRLSTSLVFYGF